MKENGHFRRLVKPHSNPWFWTPAPSPAVTPGPEQAPSFGNRAQSASEHGRQLAQEASRAYAPSAFAHSRQSTPLAARRARRCIKSEDPVATDSVTLAPVAVRLASPRVETFFGWTSRSDPADLPRDANRWGESLESAPESFRGKAESDQHARRERSRQDHDVQELIKLKDMLEVTIVGDRIELPPGASQGRRLKSADAAKSQIGQERELHNMRGPN